MEILIAIGLFLAGILILLLKKRKTRNKNFVHVSQRIDELERRI